MRMYWGEIRISGYRFMRSLAALLPKFKEISLDEFYHEINHVRNSLIRTEADELTYCFHIIIRYELEKAIFRDGVSVEELPKLWNEKMQDTCDYTCKWCRRYFTGYALVRWIFWIFPILPSWQISMMVCIWKKSQRDRWCRHHPAWGQNWWDYQMAQWEDSPVWKHPLTERSHREGMR